MWGKRTITGRRPAQQDARHHAIRAGTSNGPDVRRRDTGNGGSASARDGIEPSRNKRRTAERTKPRRTGRRPAISYPSDLPILEKRTEIIAALKEHQVLVVTGETGSGKTTQLPKICLEAGCGRYGVIGCTQPRRIAAVSIARRIADELGEEPGRSVGYKIRFEDRTQRQGPIKIMTDGILLMEARSDPFLRQYNTLIIDEAHERSVTIDFILGYLKRLLKQRDDLKVIITSATIEPEAFSRAFDDAPIIEVSGRTWPVDIRYRPIETFSGEDEASSHIEAALAAVEELKRDGRTGHILLFMPTEQDIRDTCEALKGKQYRNTLILPLYARLPAAEQQRMFQSSREDKIVVATNIAETSITVPGIRFVIDTGLARIAEYRPQSRTTGLPVKAIAKSSAVQRAGRCGRMEHGTCIRLYTEDDFNQRPDHTVPAILRTNLAETILRMFHLGLGRIENYPFIDKPRPRSIRDGYKLLLELGALKRNSGEYTLTDLGRRMAELPLDPRIARILVEAGRNGCLEEVLIIASALALQDPRERPPGREPEADRVHRTSAHPSSDYVTLLTIWKAYRSVERSEREKRLFCRDHFLSFRRMREWQSVYGELAAIIEESLPSGKKPHRTDLQGEALYRAVHRSILAGYISQIAQKKEKNLYRFAQGREAMLFPGSGLFNRGAPWIVSAEMVETSRLFARMNALIDPDWLEEAGGDFCRRSWSEPRWDAQRGEVVATEKVTLFGLVIVAGRTISFGPINPDEASEIFVRSALLEGRLSPAPAFLRHNQRRIEAAVAMENKIRKRSILADEESIMDFYRQRLGPVYDARTLKRAVRDNGSDAFLRMSDEDIQRQLPAEELNRYPDHIDLEGQRFSLTYRFMPGSERDGITLNIPGGAEDAMKTRNAEWKIPGLLREKISSLIRGLPKEYRRQLVPLGSAVDRCMRAVKGREEGSLPAILAETIRNEFGLSIPATAWPVDRLPDHMYLRYAFVGQDRRELKASRDIRSLLAQPPDETMKAGHAEERRRLERSNVTRWDFGDLAASIELQAPGGKMVPAYPALVDEEGAIHLRLFGNAGEARRVHREGVIGLYKLQFSRDYRYLQKCAALPKDLKNHLLQAGVPHRFPTLLPDRVLKTCIDGSVRREADFLETARQFRAGIYNESTRVLSLVEPVFREYGDARLRLMDLKKANPSNAQVAVFIDSLLDRLDILVPPDFTDRYADDRLERLPLYLRGTVIRAERGVIHLEKDRKKETNLRPFLEAFEEVRTTLPAFTSPEKHRKLEVFAWMLEEYKLALFAPELKKALPVSPKRLTEELDLLRSLI